jgi:hypothetical protein
MTNTKSLIAATLAVAAITATSACTANNIKPTPSSITSVTSTATTPTPSSTSMSPVEQDAKDAEQAIPKFWLVVDELSSDPYASLDKLAVVSREPSLAIWRQLLTNHRVKQVKQIGHTTVASAIAKPGDAGKFAVTACIDVSKVNLVDKDGKSVVAANRPPRVQYLYTVEKGSDGRFYVVEDKVVQTC